MTLSFPGRSIQIHGHRGCRGLFPENTIPAFLHALHLGVDVLEMDVVLSADQQVVVAHEPWLSARLGLSPTGQPIDPLYERQLNIYELPYAAIKQSTVGTLAHPDFPEQQSIATYRPLLSEVIQAVENAQQQVKRSPVGYSIEIKSSPDTEGQFHPAPAGFVNTVLAAIPPVVLPRITLLSFDTRILQVARQVQPSLRLCLLLETPFTPEKVFNTLGFIPEVLGPQFRLLTPEIIDELRSNYNALEIVPWTVNTAADLNSVFHWHINGITTDYPDRALQLL